MRIGRIAAILCITYFTVVACAQTIDLKQRFLDRYQGRILLLRGFYSSDHLLYDSSETLTGAVTSGDWTLNGFAQLNSIQVTGNLLTISARRLVVIAASQDGFEFLAKTTKGRIKKAPPLEIEINPGTGTLSAEQLDAILSRVFLNSQDSLVEQVPDYWRECIAGSANCRFSPELLSIPGVASSQSSSRLAPSTSQQSSNVPVVTDRHGVKPPRPISTPAPPFNKEARKAGIHGVVTLGLIVDNAGNPTKISILGPLGCGLDEDAVRTLETWRFEPATKDGNPVAVKIKVEMDFRSY